MRKNELEQLPIGTDVEYKRTGEVWQYAGFKPYVYNHTKFRAALTRMDMIDGHLTHCSMTTAFSNVHPVGWLKTHGGKKNGTNHPYKRTSANCGGRV